MDMADVSEYKTNLICENPRALRDAKGWSETEKWLIWGHTRKWGHI